MLLTRFGAPILTTAVLAAGCSSSHDGRAEVSGTIKLRGQLANTGEILSLINRSGNRPSHEGAAAEIDRAISVCRAGGRIDDVSLEFVA